MTIMTADQFFYKEGVYTTLSQDAMKFGVLSYSVSSLKEFQVLSQISKTFNKYAKEIEKEMSSFFDSQSFCTEYKNKFKAFVNEKIAMSDFIKKETRDQLLLNINSEEGSGKEIIARLREVEGSIVEKAKINADVNIIIAVLGVLGVCSLPFLALFLYLIDALSRALF